MIKIRFTLILSLFFYLTSVSFAQIGSDPMTFYSIGRDFQKAKKYQEAVDQFNQAILYDPSNHLFHYQKGNCLVVLKKNDEAIAAFEQAVSLREVFFPAYARLSKLYTQKKEYDKAINAYDKAFEHEKVAKKKVKYKVNTIRLLEELKRVDEIPKHIEDAKALDTKNVNFLYFQASYANQAKKYEEAAKAMEKATSLLAGKELKVVAKYYYELGLAYHHLKDAPKRDKAFEQANYGKFIPLIRNMNPSYYHKIAASFLGIYEYDICKEYIEQSFEMQTDYQPAYKTLQEIEEQLADKSAVMESLEKAIKAEKDASKRLSFVAKLAKTQLEQKLFDKAYQSSIDFLSLRPVNVEMNFVKAMAQYKKGEILKAIEVLEQAVKTLKISPEDKAKFNFALGWFYKKNSENDAAKKAFKRAMSGSFQYAAKREFDNL